ncbi:MAG: hypothetical protein HZB26_00695 [Candidatus Hydrogenedentes bacterium]|nr:hypothetical protein [Candidatus Hydrogenedentota bacterium]
MDAIPKTDNSLDMKISAARNLILGHEAWIKKQLDGSDPVLSHLVRSHVVNQMEPRLKGMTLLACMRDLKGSTESCVTAVNWMAALVERGFLIALRSLISKLDDNVPLVRRVTMEALEIAVPFEAIVWLTENENKVPLAGNRFNDTEDSLRFVRKLYSLGALAVFIDEDRIFNEPRRIAEFGGPYTDALIVYLPSSPRSRKRMIQMCNVERQRECEDEIHDRGQTGVRLWWD